jgi:hypothetical protein
LREELPMKRRIAVLVSSRGAVLIAAAVLAAGMIAGCTYYRDPSAEVIITSNRDEAMVYLVPMDKRIPAPPTAAALKEYAMGTAAPGRSIWVHHGRYWILLEKDGAWSNAVEFEVRLDYLNKIHVEF